MKSKSKNQELALAELVGLESRFIKRSAEIRDDNKVSSATTMAISREIDERKDSLAKLSGEPIEIHPSHSELLKEWALEFEYCSAAARFHSKNYGRNNDVYLELSERARTIRECINQLCQSVRINNQ